jgi:hypothetical protein
MGNIRLYGSTSGYTELAPPAVAPDGVLALPSGTGTLATTADVAAIVPGKILQVVSTFKDDTFNTSSTSFVDITGMSATITPTSTGSKILALVQMQTASSTNSQIFWVNLLRGATLIAQPASGTNPSTQTRRVGPSVNDSSNVGITFLDSPATVSATTYKLQIKVDGGVAYVNSLLSSNYSSVSTFTLMEVSA